MRLALALALSLASVPAFAADPKCEKVILTLQGAGFIKSMKIEADGAHLVVAERQWNAMQFTDKQDLGRVFTCATAPEGKSWVAVIFKSDLTDKRLGEYVGERLTIP